MTERDIKIEILKAKIEELEYAINHIDDEISMVKYQNGYEEYSEYDYSINSIPTHLNIRLAIYKGELNELNNINEDE